MPKLSLMFDSKLVREVPVGSRPVTVGRAPDNDLSVDNLAVSSYHAKIFFEGGRMVMPVGSEDSQYLQIVEKAAGQPRVTEDSGCVFVKLIGKYAWEA